MYTEILSVILLIFLIYFFKDIILSLVILSIISCICMYFMNYNFNIENFLQDKDLKLKKIKKITEREIDKY